MRWRDLRKGKRRRQSGGGIALEAGQGRGAAHECAKVILLRLRGMQRRGAESLRLQRFEIKMLAPTDDGRPGVGRRGMKATAKGLLTFWPNAPRLTCLS